jgi:hypothetical protein
MIFNQTMDVNRFSILLKKFFGRHATAFLNSLWNPVIKDLTLVMNKYKDNPGGFLDARK